MADLIENTSKFIPLTETTFLILLALLEPRHGYGIMQVAAQLSEGRVKIGPGTLYGALNVLVKQGLIERRGEMESEGERRKIYGLTELGGEVVRLESERLALLAEAARKALAGIAGTSKEDQDVR
jgi:DNA-binding PadR family transcriptional regulator